MPAGKRGPKPTPTAILKARGSRRAQGRPDASTGPPATPPAELPACPVWVSDAVKSHWETIGGYLLGLGVVTTGDTIALGMLLDALADYLSAVSEASGQPATLENDKRNVHANPVYAVKAAAWARLMKALQEFGLTPASRASIDKVGVVPSGEKATGKDKGRFLKPKR